MFPNPVEEGGWGGWKEFFKGTNGLLQPNEKCDCAHYDGRFYENRRYIDRQANITLSYMMFRGLGVDGTNDSDSFNNPDPVQHTVRWNSRILPAVEKLTPRPTVIVMNVGIFPLHKENPPEAMIEGMLRLAPTVIWKTTTYALNDTGELLNSRSSKDQLDLSTCRHPGVTCLDASWTGRLDSRHYWDNKHFREPVYTALNDQLCDILDGVTHS